MNASLEPKLAAPGAGLPTPELFVARVLFGWRRWRGSRAAFDARFRTERAAIHALLAECDAQRAARRVLISRIRGMEDSSRHWSVWMTLDHLRIVNGQISRIIDALAKGAAPAGTASTADVKPSPDVSASIAGDYEASCDALLATASATPNLKTAARFAHPWFGPLDAAGWHALAGVHMGIHCAQIERILAGQSSAGE